MSDDVKAEAATLAVEPTVTHSWRDALPVELRNNDYIKDFTKPGQVVEKYIELVKSSEQHKTEIPQDPSGYDIAIPDGDVKLDDNLVNGFRDIAHKTGMTKEQVKNLYNWYVNEQKNFSRNVSEQIKQAEQVATEKLKQEWKGTDFEKNQAIAVGAFKKFADPESFAFLDSAVVDGIRLGNHPTFLKLFKRIGDLTANDSAVLRDDRGNVVMSDQQKASLMFPSMNKNR